MPLVIVAIGVILLLLLMIRFKMNGFIALVLVALAVGLMQGMPLDKVIGSIKAGVGGTLGSLALIMGFGAMLGKMLADCGGAQRIAAIGNKSAKNVVLFIGDGMGDSEITVARNYLKGVNGHFDGLDAVGQPGALDDVEAGTGQYTTFSLGSNSSDSAKSEAKRS